MPIYEYSCPKCGVFETTQRITEDALKKCPTCKSKVRKLISNTSFQLKGSGWYVTDYAKKGSGKESGGTSSDSGSSTAKSSDSGDAKSKDTAGESKSSESKPAGETKSKKKDASSKAA